MDIELNFDGLGLNTELKDVGVNIQSNADILAMCYDEVIKINEKLLVANVKGTYGVIDYSNNIIKPFEKGKITKFGNMLFLYDGYSRYKLLDNGYNAIGTGYTKVEELEDMILVAKYGCHGLLDENGNTILPVCYRTIRLSKDKINHYEMYVVYQGEDFIIKVDKNTHKPDKYDFKEIKGTNIQLIGQHYDTRETLWEDEIHIRYAVQKNYNTISDDLYDNAIYKMGYRHFGLIHVMQNGKVGMLRDDGKEVVPVVYDGVEYIGSNGVYLVTSRGKWGIYKEDIGETVGIVFSQVIKNDKGVPFYYLYRRYNDVEDWWILGNDGRAYREINKAFDIDKIEDNRFKIRVYGAVYEVDSQLKILNRA